jgi:hypothetical protein
VTTLSLQPGGCVQTFLCYSCHKLWSWALDGQQQRDYGRLLVSSRMITSRRGLYWHVTGVGKGGGSEGRVEFGS